LYGRHKRTRPCRCIFDERSGERNTGFIGISDGMSKTGIGNTCNGVRFHSVALCQFSTAVVAHLFYTDALIGRSRIAVVNPEERTYFHVFATAGKCFGADRSDDNHFARSQFFVILILTISMFINIWEKFNQLQIIILLMVERLFVKLKDHLVLIYINF